MNNFSCPLCRGEPISFKQNVVFGMEASKWKTKCKFNPRQCAEIMFQESDPARNDLLRAPTMTREEFLNLPRVARRNSTNSIMEQLRLHTHQLRNRLTEVTSNVYGILGEVERVNAEIDRLSSRISIHLNERRAVWNNRIPGNVNSDSTDDTQ